MKNREKYRDEILNSVFSGKKYCEFAKKNVLPNLTDCTNGECEELHSCGLCLCIFGFWLDEEYEEPEVDWDKVPVDTLVRVRNSKNENWKLRHFKRIRDTTESHKFETWGERQTSRTTDGNISLWRYCESVEDEEDGSN